MNAIDSEQATNRGRDQNEGEETLIPLIRPLLDRVNLPPADYRAAAMAALGALIQIRKRIDQSPERSHYCRIKRSNGPSLEEAGGIRLRIRLRIRPLIRARIKQN
mgnify:CR=1 FL=1